MRLALALLIVTVVATVAGLLALLPGRATARPAAHAAVAHKSSKLQYIKIPVAVTAPATPAREPAPAAAPAPATPAERGQAAADKLRASGPTSAPWTGPAHQALDGWRAAAKSELLAAVELSPLECYQAGCLTTATYADHGAFAALDDSLPQSEGFLNYPGWRYRTGPTELASGRVTATWFFLSPTTTR